MNDNRMSDPDFLREKLESALAVITSMGITLELKTKYIDDITKLVGLGGCRHSLCIEQRKTVLILYERLVSNMEIEYNRIRSQSPT